MKIVSVVSPKGGVGKTTITVNLGVALQRAGHQVLLVDMDPQSALRFHLGVDLAAGDGLAPAALGQRPWRDICLNTAAGVALLPFGHIEDDAREQLETEMQQSGDWLRSRLEQMGLLDDAVVLVDTPPGASVYMRHALQACHIAVVVTLADAASYATLPSMEHMLAQYCEQRSDFDTAGYLVNQFDAANQLAQDVTGLMRQNFGRSVIGVVHKDAAVSEAIACRRSVLDYAPHSQATSDFLESAQWLNGRLAAVRPD
ncbi:cellulose biosynthesis protein BcsQ [Kerstersia similis]|uniref:cellulose biosynthesis protein BcsQ n=1 Tax=Kerstersia similis TaxID=206505 RepID=UPI0039EF8F6D